MLNKTILLLASLLCLAASAAAQDLIVKTDSTKIEARILEISPDDVRYKRFSNLDGPTYVLPVQQIAYLRYANGEVERLQAAPAAAPAPAATAPAASAVPAEPAPVPTPRMSARNDRYEVGQFYDQDGVKGVVCMVDEEGLHGLVISLDESKYIPWSTFDKEHLRLIGCDDHADGAANMEKMAAYIAANNLSWEDFPAFDWCRQQGEGWYLPAIDELLVIGHNYNGGDRVHNNRQARNHFNDALRNNGGQRMDRLVYYFSSTEKDEKSAWTSHTDLQPPYVIEIPKYQKFLVRAVHKF